MEISKKILGKYLPEIDGYSFETKKKILKAMEEYAQMKVNELNKSDVNGCVCAPEESNGWTTVKCCNQCGLPVEKFWCKH